MSGAAVHALFVSVRLHGEVVDEHRFASGRSVRIGPGGQVPVPVPDGVSSLAEVVWRRRDLVEVVDGTGATHLLGPDDALSVASGPMSVELSLAKQFALRRTAPFPWVGSLTFFTLLLATTLSVSQIELIMRYQCDWLPLVGMSCPVENQGGRGAGSWNAEYIARLLREDYEGEDDGDVEQDTPEQVHVIKSEYVPAGDLGPTETLGGSEETAPEPVRATEEETPEPGAAKKQEVDVITGGGDPMVVETPAEPDEPEGDAVTDAGVQELDDEEEPDDDLAEDPKEEKRGWGFRDWIDAEDVVVESQIRLAKRRLRIDPNDPDALGLLAYYQYLAQDYDDAKETFDRIIELMPESSHGYNNKALIYKRQGDWATEEALYRVALALDPGDETAINNLAVNLAHQGRFEEALAYMKRLETMLPDDAYTDLHRAKIYAQMGKDELALDMLDRSLRGMERLDVLHHIEFRQDIRVDPSFSALREDARFHAILNRYYGDDAPVRR